MQKLFTVANFYKFIYLENYEEMRIPLLDKMKMLDIKGTILLGDEGVNASISAESDKMEEFLSFIVSDDRFSDIRAKLSYSEFQPFQKVKVKLRKEIVTLGLDNLSLSKRGEYLNHEEWDCLLKTEEVFLIDARNDYEVNIGTFKNAISPSIKTFRDFVDWTQEWINSNYIDKETAKIAQFCTGGIRCEKTTAYYKELGFKNVYHLEGGILKYLEDSKNKNNLWEGGCFVFDDRVSIDENLNMMELHCKKCNNIVRSNDLNNISKGYVVCKECSVFNEC